MSRFARFVILTTITIIAAIGAIDYSIKIYPSYKTIEHHNQTLQEFQKHDFRVIIHREDRDSISVDNRDDVLRLLNCFIIDDKFKTTSAIHMCQSGFEIEFISKRKNLLIPVYHQRIFYPVDTTFGYSGLFEMKNQKLSDFLIVVQKYSN